MKNFYEMVELLAEAGMVIHQRDPVRGAVASMESYWPKPGAALTTAMEILRGHGYIIPYASFAVHDKTPDYTQRFEVQKMVDPKDPNSDTEETGSWLVLSWHWMPSGSQCEVTCYLS
jgi:hypothetical protein